MNADLNILVKTAGLALELEDRYLLGSVAANRQAYPGENGGILRLNNERYYQFIVARSLVSSYPFAAEIEVDFHDLVLRYPGDSKIFAAIEMKRWMTSNGYEELESIKRDVVEKLAIANSEKSFLIVFFANPVQNSVTDNLKWLSENINIPVSSDSHLRLSVTEF